MKKVVPICLAFVALISASLGARGVNSHFGFDGYDEFYGVSFGGFGYFLPDDSILTGGVAFGKGDLLLGGSWTRWEDDTSGNYQRGFRCFAVKRFPYGEESAFYTGVSVGREDDPSGEEWGFALTTAFRLPITFDGHITVGFQYGDYGSFGNYLDGFVNIFYDFGGVYLYGEVKGKDEGYLYDFQTLELGVGKSVDNANFKLTYIEMKRRGNVSRGVGISVELVSESW